MATVRRLILVGMMGSGKTTVGHLLAAASGWPYVDNDHVLAEQRGRTARDISTQGEGAVRIAETEALRAELAMPEPCIVGAAAGTILDLANRELIEDAGTVVWLRARPETLAARVAGSPHRPWLDADPLAWLKLAATERDPLYGSIADVTVDVDEATPAQTAAQILARVRLH